jgi:hypothetical protein
VQEREKLYHVYEELSDHLGEDIESDVLLLASDFIIRALQEKIEPFYDRPIGSYHDYFNHSVDQIITSKPFQVLCEEDRLLADRNALGVNSPYARFKSFCEKNI